MTPIWLKNITVFTLQSFPVDSTEQLEDALATHPFVPCGQLEREQHGFDKVFAQESLVRKTNEVFWAEVKSEVKSVPGSLVKRMLNERIQEIENKDGRKVGKKEKKELKEIVFDELLAQALAKQSSTLVMIDPVKGYVLINSTSTKKVDLIVGLLINSIDGLDLTRLSFENPISKQMANLLLSDAEDFIFATDSNLLLKGPGSPAATVRFAKHSLQLPQVIAHITAGLQPASMEMMYNDRISFILSDPFSIRGLKYTDEVQDELPDTTSHADELIDSTLWLQTGELRNLLEDLRLWLGKEPESLTTEAE